jgi:hypothetical protein
LDERKLYGDLHKAAILGGDHITTWGRGTGKQILDIRCQCSPIYWGNKVNRVTGSIQGSSDNRDATYIAMTARINAMAKKVKQVLTLLESNGISFCFP